MKEAYVYLIKGGKFHKIGWAIDPKKRRTQLQAGNPQQLEIVWTKTTPSWYIATQIEKTIHNTYARKKVRGEWYKLSKRDVREIQEYV